MIVELRLTLEDVEQSLYVEVPFEVNNPNARVGVTMTYDRSGGAAIDLGLLDADGIRGWSGGERSTYVVTQTAATPGYRPGPMPPGRWAVLLGLYRVPADGVPVTVTIDTATSDEPESEAPGPAPRVTARGSDRAHPAPLGMTWFAGDMHAHTVHSDGNQSIAQLAALATGMALDFIAVADHNTVSHHPLLPEHAARYDISLLPAQEVTTLYGHANVFGDVGQVDFRTPPDQWRIQSARRGGLMSINHPLEDDCGWLHQMAELPPALELWHIGWFRNLTDNKPWALTQRWPQSPIVIGGSDFHKPESGYPPGVPTTWVAAEDRSPEAILEGVKAGRTAINRMAAAKSALLLPVDGELLALDADGSTLVGPSGRMRAVRGASVRLTPQEPGIHRLETPAKRELLAICVI
jgi:hypothetical protein